MALYSGVVGALKVKKGTAGTDNTACVATFTIDISASIGEAACLGQEFKKKAAGIKDWTASFDGPADFSDAGQKDLLDAVIAGDEIEATFELDATTYLKGSGFLESFSISHDAEGIATVSGGISGNGALTPTIPAIPAG